MPELPEVETVRRGLAPALVGKRIKRARTKRPDLRFPFPPRFGARLSGRRVDALERRAKYILAHLDDGMVWITHLGMTGRWSILGQKRQPGDFYYAEPPDPAHTHVVIEMEEGAKGDKVLLEFNDPRRFGYMDLIAESELDSHPFFKSMGPEPLGNEFHEPYLKRALAGKKTSIKAALLDQRVVAGLGNIYVVEALHRAGIAPTKPAGRISAQRLDKLYHAIRAVLEEAIEAGGSTLSDYAQVDGAQGGFQHRFRVYDREGAPCSTEGCAGAIKRAVHGGRSTFWCPRCQR
ncbi:MAG TPA: bifunctional DNA-formamidopyrimidine glycosylase/DNA-(apurinic or apyrimidinic site) lyase [Vitreimonas sp.]|uniref:bifunctional DNA-formamidopyrimidine glycosylase/DNA-(apurinic or apyrimidinic site) lyase n=1 Tax=Vitreimonas sp. TaxID=3069702 RepID=UPI002D26C3FF|nr:bifunctional DNA-formamidopyrimidine glycosylase/DNA-(apurinic or apyrimidinic site) lyase [Vitreimonas sp.]HYD87401.1 bifunctional DNA-formamidopyrimidine glycosylase/DNA-(apurinic or apyrimidinic site) lyase [Vitreimonas sp.]